MISDELWNALFRFSQQCLGVELAGGGVKHPPACRGKSRQSVGRGLNWASRRYQVATHLRRGESRVTYQAFCNNNGGITRGHFDCTWLPIRNIGRILLNIRGIQGQKGDTWGIIGTSWGCCFSPFPYYLPPESFLFSVKRLNGLPDRLKPNVTASMRL